MEAENPQQEAKAVEGPKERITKALIDLRGNPMMGTPISYDGDTYLFRKLEPRRVD